MKCYSRVLHPFWANALADHWKPFEVQKYSGCNRNAMKFATDDAGEKVVIVGAKGENVVTAVAKVDSVVRNISARHMENLKMPLPAGLIAELEEYLEGGACYDVLLFSQIYDIRSEKLSWQAMEKTIGCKINRNCGFPRILGVKEDRLRGIMSKGKVRTFGWAFAEDLVESSGSDSTYTSSTSEASDETANKRRCLTWWHE